MKLPNKLREWLLGWATDVAASRDADFILSEDDRVYLLRWHVIPPNPFLSLYVHMFLGPDFGRHLHDHRSGSLSLVLSGKYHERHTTPRRARLQFTGSYNWRHAGDIVYRPARRPHMIEHVDNAVTIFITGPTWRDWGFWVGGTWMSHKRYFDAQKAGPK